MSGAKKNIKTALALTEILENSPAPVTAKNIITKLIEKGIDVWPSTVYRILEKLVKSGKINKVTLINDNTVYYEHVSQTHLHIAYCLNCKKRQEIHICPIPKIESEVLESTGFKVTEHKMELYGYCEKCSKNKP